VRRQFNIRGNALTLGDLTVSEARRKRGKKEKERERESLFGGPLISDGDQNQEGNEGSQLRAQRKVPEDWEDEESSLGSIIP